MNSFDNSLNKVIGKSHNEVLKTLAYQYKRRKDQFAELTESQKVGLRWTVVNEYSKLFQTDKVEFLSNESAKSKYNVDLDKYEDCFDFFRRQHLLISSDNNNSELMPGHTNLMFRAWHDYIHFSNGYAFDFLGEFLTWEEHCKNIKDETIKKVLFSEVVLQAAYYLVFGEFSPVQKIVLLPDEYIDLATELVYFNSPKNN